MFRCLYVVQLNTVLFAKYDSFVTYTADVEQNACCKCTTPFSLFYDLLSSTLLQSVISGFWSCIFHLVTVGSAVSVDLFGRHCRHGHSCMKPDDFFVLHGGISTSITRGHNFKLFKPQRSLDVRKYSFAYPVIDGTACQVILLMHVAFLHLNTN